jgi:hypothetical protein
VGNVCISLYGDYEEDDLIGFHTYHEGEWHPVGTLQLRQGGGMAEGMFDPFPENFAAFKPLGDLD